MCPTFMNMDLMELLLYICSGCEIGYVFNQGEKMIAVAVHLSLCLLYVFGARALAIRQDIEADIAAASFAVKKGCRQDIEADMATVSFAVMGIRGEQSSVKNRIN
ncbi:hypothetical protein DITRI_Ditri15bG0095600 [Diplodiscus trichospermus]